MKKIQAEAKSVGEVLLKKYKIDYYQRSYKWGRKQASELISDLYQSFNQSYKESDHRSAGKTYEHYFLGSVIISAKDDGEFIIDGQQRLTTLTLILIHIHNIMPNDEDKAPIKNLIFSVQRGVKSFNLEVDERIECMDALYRGVHYDGTDKPDSVKNILARYADITEEFPEDLKENKLLSFTDWLTENVYLVKITTDSDEDAYTIFETMNDRGLSLTPTDMLKGYLLSKIGETDQRTKVNAKWNLRIQELLELGKNEEADAIKAWLRSQYAQSTRERKRGATPKDFDLIGTQFHRWVRSHLKQLGLGSSDDYVNFITNDFNFFTSQYIRLRRAAETWIKELECVYYNAQSNFTLQYPVLLAPICLEDSDEVILQKFRITSSYLDIILTRRVWNFKFIGYSSMQYAMFNVMRDVRGKSVPELVEILCKKLDDYNWTFSTEYPFSLHGQNRIHIQRILARITAHIETRSGRPSRYADFITRSGKKGYEIEHIWANHYERHTDDFDHHQDFSDYRNRIGGLLLLPKDINASLGDMPYAEKVGYYNSKNLLARTLHENCYERNPDFLKYLKESGLPFKPHAEFKRADLDARQELYIKIAEEIWNPDRLEQELSA